MAMPRVGGRYPSSLYDVSCITPRACIAVGSQTAERWSGSRWRFMSAPTPRNGAAVTSISCTSMSACTAVGGARKDQHGVPLIKRWNGSQWSTQASPDPTRRPVPGLGQDSQLRGVSCTSARDCVAVGHYGYNGNDHLGWALVERWNGSRWSIIGVPRPPDATFSELGSVSCSSPRACTAVGDYDANTANGSVIELPLAERYSGGRWSVQAAPNPGGDTGSALNGVGCASAQSCVAAGVSALNSTNGQAIPMQPLAEIWNGSGWSVQSPTTPSSVSESELGPVSCASVRSCSAVGEYRDGSTGGLGALAARWDGSRWSVTLFPESNVGITKQLDGISCPTTRWCIAVGNALAERYTLMGRAEPRRGEP